MKRRRFSMRFQLLLMYFFLVFAVCLSYVPMSGQVRAQLHENYEEQLTLRFKQSLDILEDSVRQVYHVPDTMGNSANYREALMAQGREGISAAFSKFYLTNELLNQYISTIPVIDKAFVLFKNSGAVMDEAQLYLTTDDFISFGMVVPGCSLEEQRAILNGEAIHYQFSHVRLGPSVSVSSRPGLLIFIDRPHTQVRLGIVYYEETLLDLFHFDSLPPNSSFILSDLNGNPVYQYGQPMEDDYCYRERAYISSMEMALYIPQEYFDSFLKSFDDMFANTLAVALGAGLLLSIVLTLLNYRPLKQLLRLSGKKPSLAQSNEYALLYEHIQASDSQIAGLHADVLRLRDNLQASLFARLLYGTVRSAHAIDLSWKLFPQLKNAQYVALVKMSSPENDASNQPYFFGFLQPLEDEGVHVQQMNLNTAALLLPEDEALVQRLHALLEKEQAMLDNSGVSLFAGISESFTGVDGVYLAHHQAQMALANHRVLERYAAPARVDLRPFVDMTALQRLYELLFAGEGDAAEDIIRNAGQEMISRSASRDQQIQYCSMIRFSFDLVVADLRLGDLPKPLSSIHDMLHISLPEMLDALVGDARMLTEAVGDMRRKAGGKSRERIMHYIRENFASPSIYAESIAKANDVSANTVYQIVRECTGRSLGDYIESLRLERASELLKTTDLPVMEIAAQCGWSVPATFYRAFKQSFGIPPAQFRKQKDAKQE